MESVVTKISAAQRMEMVMRGMNPRDPKEVSLFLSGGALPINEKMERVKTLVGNSNNLGGGKEKEVDALSMTGQTMDASSFEREVGPASPRVQQDYRKLMQEDMNDYAAPGKVFNTDDLMTFRQPTQQPGPSKSANLEQIKLEGFNSSKQYLNAFVVNLQTPSYQTRVALYKLLLACLKGEEKYKDNTNALEAYRSGVKQAEAAMLKNLQG